MNLFISKLISSVLQIILFAAIPMLWWFVSARKTQSFARWIGLTRIEGGRSTLAAMLLVTVAFLLTGTFTLYTLRGIETAASEFEGLGVRALPAVVIYAAFNTAFPEELLFRGFLLKRMKQKLGLGLANFIQSLLFGLLHGAMFFSMAGVWKTILIILLTGTVAWLMGIINERCAGGSIVPGWIIHTVSNLFSGICSAFSLI